MSDRIMTFSEEVAWMLGDLAQFRLEVMLVPAPDPRFVGHKVRVSTGHNPAWYRVLYWSYPTLKRCHLIEALERCRKARRVVEYYRFYVEEALETFRHCMAEEESQLWRMAR